MVPITTAMERDICYLSPKVVKRVKLYYACANIFTTENTIVYLWLWKISSHSFI